MHCTFTYDIKGFLDIYDSDICGIRRPSCRPVLRSGGQKWILEKINGIDSKDNPIVRIEGEFVKEGDRKFRGILSFDFHTHEGELEELPD